MKVVLLEAKTNKTLSDTSLCQVVGYYMATIVESEVPPLGVVMTENVLQFVFFPYRSSVKATRDIQIVLCHHKSKCLKGLGLTTTKIFIWE